MIGLLAAIITRCYQVTFTGDPYNGTSSAQFYTGASNEGWDTNLGHCTVKGASSIPESKLHLNVLVLKVVQKEFEHLCNGQVVLVTTDKTGLHKQRNSMRPGSLCVLLVLLQADLPEGLPHIGLFKHDSRQDLSSQAGHSDGMVHALGHFKQICL